MGSTSLKNQSSQNSICEEVHRKEKPNTNKAKSFRFHFFVASLLKLDVHGLSVWVAPKLGTVKTNDCALSINQGSHSELIEPYIRKTIPSLSRRTSKQMTWKVRKDWSLLSMFVCNLQCIHTYVADVTEVNELSTHNVHGCSSALHAPQQLNAKRTSFRRIFFQLVLSPLFSSVLWFCLRPNHRLLHPIAHLSSVPPDNLDELEFVSLGCLASMRSCMYDHSQNFVHAHSTTQVHFSLRVTRQKPNQPVLVSQKSTFSFFDPQQLIVTTTASNFPSVILLAPGMWKVPLAGVRWTKARRKSHDLHHTVHRTVCTFGSSGQSCPHSSTQAWNSTSTTHSHLRHCSTHTLATACPGRSMQKYENV